MKKTIIAALVAVAALAVPGIASAHTGTVSCNSTGVIFHYNADFPTALTVTQTVNGVSNNVLVPAHTTSDFTVPLPGVTGVTASATRPTNITVVPVTHLTCPVPPGEPVPAPTCPVGTDQDASSTSTTVVCIKTVTVQAPPPDCVPQTVYVEVPGKTLTKTITKIVVKHKTRWRVVYKFIKYTPVKQPKHPRAGGTLG